jgi:hypothetical protein
MSGPERIAGSIGVVLMIVLLLAVLRKGHWRTLPFFTALIVCVIATQAPIAIDPVRFYRWDFWLFHDTATAALRFGVALELANRVFRGFPGAAASALNAVLAVVAITGVALVGMYSPTASYERIVTELVPGIAQGTAWIFTVIAALALWYRIPLAPLPKAILLSYTPYLLILTFGRQLIAETGWVSRAQIGWCIVFAYAVVKVYWTSVAWWHPAHEPVAEHVGIVAPRQPRVA